MLNRRINIKKMNIWVFSWIPLLKSGNVTCKIKSTKDMMQRTQSLKFYLFMSFRSLSAKIWGLGFFFFWQCVSLRKFYPSNSYIAIPAYEMITCRWCLALIFCVLHMCVHTQRVHSCSHCTRKLVNASKRKTFSAASIKWSKPAWHLLTFLDCCASQQIPC